MRCRPLFAACFCFLLCFALRGAVARAEVVCGSSLFDTQPAAFPVPHGLAAAAVLFGDVDGDGVQDLVELASGVTVAYRAASGALGVTASYPAAGAPSLDDATGMLLADLDGDGAAEIIVRTVDRVQVLGGKGAALRLLGEITVDPTIFVPVMAVGHFRSAVQADLVVASAPATLALYRLASGALVKGATLSGAVDAVGASGLSLLREATAADVDGDGIDDLLYPTATGIGLARLGARPTWERFKDLPVAGGYNTLVTGDFDGDGRTDIAAVDHGLGLHTWLQPAAGTFSAAAPAAVPWFDGPVFAADLTGDGAAELIMRQSVGRLAGGAWGFAALPVALERVSTLFDWDGDGALDMIGASYTLRAAAYLPSAWADLSIATAGVPGPTVAGQSVAIVLAVTNNGPSATEGLKITTVPAGPSITVDGCPDGACAVGIAPHETVPVTVRTWLDTKPLTLQLSVCSAVRDRVPATNTTTVSLAAPQASADLSATFSFNVSNGRFTVLVDAENGGPSPATNVRFDLHFPAEGSIATWRSDPAGASCTTAPGRLSCTIARIDAQSRAVVVGEGVLPYRGQAVAMSVDITSDVGDPFVENNHFEGGLPDIGTVVPGAGCGCVLSPGRGSWGVVVVAALVALVAAGRRRRSRR